MGRIITNLGSTVYDVRCTVYDNSSNSSTSSIKTPSFSLKGIKKGFKITVKKQSGIWAFDVQFSLKKNMKKSEEWRLYQETRLTDKYTGLKRKKKYYVRVRAIDDNINYGNWSSIKTVKTK